MDQTKYVTLQEKVSDLCQSELDDNTTDLSNLVQRFARRNFEYLAKYLMKGEKLPFVVKNVFANVIRKTDENNTLIKFLASWERF